MKDSAFQNPNGLDAQGHRSSAADMAKLTACAMKREDFRRIVSTASVTIGERTMTNHNKLLRLCEGCIGVKTGYTKAAGRTLVSAVERDGMTLICVTLNDGNDWNDHMALYDEAFSEYELRRAASGGSLASYLEVIGGTVPLVPVVLDRDLSYPLTGDETLSIRVTVPDRLAAPVLPGQRVGWACACLDGQEVARVAVIAAAPSAMAIVRDKEDSLWDRLTIR